VRVDLARLAEKTGFSISTVSRALNNRPGVALETRRKILKAAQELNYIPNRMAAHLASASSGIIGFLTLNLSNPFYVPVAIAVEDAVAERGYSVVIAESKRRLDRERVIVRRFAELCVAGAVVVPTLEMDDVGHLIALRDLGVPVVLIGRKHEQLDYVSVDNIKVGQLAARHLLELGHERVGIVKSGEPFNYPERERMQGFVQVLQDAGRQVVPENEFVVGNNRLEGGLAAADLFLQCSERPTAIFCMNDMLAIGFVHGVLEGGVRVPEEVAVVGVDDVDLAAFTRVPLTTVVLPKYELGEIAARLLFDKIEYQSPARYQHVILEPRLVVRKSTVS